MTRCDLFIFAAEASGDLHGQALLSELSKLNPHLNILSVAGPLMRKERVKSLMRMEEFQVMGFVDVFLALPRIARLFYQLARQILAANPKVCLFIDYPGFALRMEKHLRKKGYKGKLIHYISPTVWIHGKGRIKTMGATLDELLCILPFEPALFRDSSLTARYVGHPLIERVGRHTFHPIAALQGKKVIALFPGSRKKEIERNFPLYLNLAKEWSITHPKITFAVSISRKEHTALIQKMLADYGLNSVICIEEERTYDLMKSALFAIAKSGTVTLELALHSVPTCVTYAVGKIDIFIAQKLLGVNLPFYSLPNILCEEKVYPELIGPFFTIDNLKAEAELLLESSQREKQKKQLEKIRKLLGESHASRSAAKHVHQALESSTTCYC